MKRKVTLVMAALAAALGAMALPAEVSARPLGFGYHGGGGYHASFYGARAWHGGWRGHGWGPAAVGLGYASGALVGNYVYATGYDPYYYAPQAYVTDEYLDRYYDTEIYTPNCFRRQTVTTWDGYASAVVNTCY